jgi:hypothetical protein
MIKDLKGPGGIVVRLDSSEIFPDDPGNGTPAMVYLGRHSATYWCAIGENELLDSEGRVRTLSAKLYDWLVAQDDEVTEFCRSGEKNESLR